MLKAALSSNGQARRSEKMKPATYFFIRMAATVLALVAGSLSALQRDESPLAELPPMATWFLAGLSLLGLLLTPFLVAGIIRVQSLGALASEPLCWPSHSANPLTLRSPHLFFHFAAFFVMAHGVGALLTSPFGGGHQLTEGAFQLAGGAACLAGVHLGMRKCRDGLREEHMDSEQSTGK